MQFRISFFWDDLKFDSHMYICNKIKKLENDICIQTLHSKTNHSKSKSTNNFSTHSPNPLYELT